MAEEAVRFVIEKLLRPIGIDVSAKTFNEAAIGSEEVLNEMKQSVYMFLGHILFSNKQEARNWIRKCTPYIATDVLRLLGFDPFLFDLDGNTQHLLVTLCWLIWRSDLFNTLYEPLLPKDDSYLPPYGVLCSDETEQKPKPVQKPPQDPSELTLRIQRLTGRIGYQLQTLSDLEVTRETLHWQIRAIDPDSSLYALSLKSKPSILQAHIDALRLAVQNSEKLKELARIEQTFWRWAFTIIDNLFLDSDKFDETRSLPCDWFPAYTRAPFTRHNKGVDDLNDALTEMREKLEKCQEKVGTGRLNERQSGLNGRQIDLIKREIDDLMESLERVEEVKLEEKSEQTEIKLIPDLPFKDFGDAKLQRIVTKSEYKSEDIAARSCPKIAQLVSEFCAELGYVPHGWKCNVKMSSRETEEEDANEKPPPRPKKKTTIVARPSRLPAASKPVTTKVTGGVASRNVKRK